MIKSRKLHFLSGDDKNEKHEYKHHFISVNDNYIVIYDSVCQTLFFCDFDDHLTVLNAVET